MRFAAALFTVFLLLSLRAYAGQLEDGKVAARHGDVQTALKLWRPLADQGNAEAQIAIGGLYKSGRHGMKPDNTEATKWFQKAINNLQPLADEGNPQAQFLIGHMHWYGFGFPEDHAAAFTWWQKAADLGYPKAETAVGNLYAVNDNPDPSIVKNRSDMEAMKWYRKAATHGYVPAEKMIGLLYDFAQDKAEALKWWRKASDDGDAQAAWYIADHYKSHGGPDDAEALKWFLRAAELGDDHASSDIGWIYESGRGVTQNYVLAYKWYSIGAASEALQKYKPNTKHRDQLTAKMTRDQIAEAQKLAAEWKPTPAPATATAP